MPNRTITISEDELQVLIDILARGGYRIIGPIERDGAIIYDDISSISDLPKGRTDEQSNAAYRLKKSSEGLLFGYSLGAQSWKRFLHLPEEHLWSATKYNRGFRIKAKIVDPPKMAFLGVRPCDLAAIAMLDKALLDGPYTDPAYARLRKDLFIIAVNCSQAGGTCFCVSMKTGPKAVSGFDLALTELAGDSHRFLVEIGSDAGVDVARAFSGRTATEDDIRTAETITRQTARNMGRTLNTGGLKELLYRNLDNSRWELTGSRCLTCGNCTMVSPTCFCTTVEDTTDLAGRHADRIQKWDSCFTVDFSYIHGGSIRTSSMARYRQMVTHKLAGWHDQFGSSGCVGCGRCITWCPAAIDITEEVRAVQESERAAMMSTKAKEITNADN
jgi:sulfhydrogenase subunit beta (sulfur reductase)